MLYLLALRQVSAINWGTLARQASSYTTSLNPTKPNLTFYHRVRVHMPAGDLSHEMNLMTYPDMREDNMATGPYEVHCTVDPSASLHVVCRKTTGNWTSRGTVALSTLSSPMDLCSNRLLGLKDVLHETDCGVRPRVNSKVQSEGFDTSEW